MGELEAAQAALDARLAAALQRIAELEQAGAGALAEPTAEAVAQESPAASKASDEAMAVVPLTKPRRRSAAPSGVPLLLSVGKWGLAAGAAAALSIAAATLGGSADSQRSRRPTGSGAKAAPAPAPAAESSASA